MLRHVAFVSILLAVSCMAADSDSRESSVAALAEDLDLKPFEAPTREDVVCLLQRRFSQDSALQGLDRIQSALTSFAQLTTLAKPAVPAEKLNAIGNLGWEEQHLGLPNCVGAVRGTLHKQRYMIARLKCDLAQERLKHHEISEAEAKKARLECERAKQAFVEFWNSFCIAD